MVAADAGPDVPRNVPRNAPSNALVVICDRSDQFGHALAHRAAYELAARGHDMRFVDLGEDGPDGVVGLVTPSTASVVVVHPDWRDRPPAPAVALLDRVLAGGAASRDVLVLVTSDERDASSPATAAGPPEAVWQQCASDPGVRLHRRVVGPVAGSTAEQRAGWLAEIDLLLPRT